jgi:predicted nucleic acid-binding protein
MSRVVVDTDIASYLFNWHSSAKALADSLRGFELVLSFMTVAEMRTGAIAANSGLRRRDLLEQYSHGFAIAYANDSMCTEWAKLRASARAMGRAVSIQDAWIAASALDLKAPLATNNRNDFKHIKGLRLLFSQPS